MTDALANLSWQECRNKIWDWEFLSHRLFKSISKTREAQTYDFSHVIYDSTPMLNLIDQLEDDGKTNTIGKFIETPATLVLYMPNFNWMQLRIELKPSDKKVNFLLLKSYDVMLLPPDESFEQVKALIKKWQSLTEDSGKPSNLSTSVMARMPAEWIYQEALYRLDNELFPLLEMGNQLTKRAMPHGKIIRRTVESVRHFIKETHKLVENKRIAAFDKLLKDDEDE